MLYNGPLTLVSHNHSGYSNKTEEVSAMLAARLNELTSKRQLGAFSGYSGDTLLLGHVQQLVMKFNITHL